MQRIAFAFLREEKLVLSGKHQSSQDECLALDPAPLPFEKSPMLCDIRNTARDQSGCEQILAIVHHTCEVIVCS
jgi:hypothetical protein